MHRFIRNQVVNFTGISSLIQEKSIFCPFDESVELNALAADLSGAMADESHPLCQLAAIKLQAYLQSQQVWEHNIGLLADGDSTVIGKIFGILVDRTKEGKLGYLSAFSGKLADRNDHVKFVPPIFDGRQVVF